MKKIAITGNVAAGKSTVAKYFKQFGAFVLSADKISNELLSKKNIKNEIIEILGKKVLENDLISKEKMAKEIFKEKDKLLKIEKVMHKKILKEIKQKYDLVKKEKKYLFFIVEIPLLFEIKKERFFDYVITIAADISKRKKRFKKKYFEKREKRLLSENEKIQKADFVIYNNFSFSNLKNQVKELSKLLSKI